MQIQARAPGANTVREYMIQIPAVMCNAADFVTDLHHGLFPYSTM